MEWGDLRISELYFAMPAIVSGYSDRELMKTIIPLQLNPKSCWLRAHQVLFFQLPFSFLVGKMSSCTLILQPALLGPDSLASLVCLDSPHGQTSVKYVFGFLVRVRSSERSNAFKRVINFN